MEVQVIVLVEAVVVQVLHHQVVLVVIKGVEQVVQVTLVVAVVAVEHLKVSL
jgi:hypothetical protein